MRLQALLALLLCLGPMRATAQRTKATETVLVTHRVKKGKESEYTGLLKRKWSTLRRLGLVLARPHVILRGNDESGKTIFVEILTWKDHDAPENVPPEVAAIRKKFETLVEERLGHRGIEFPEFEIVQTEEDLAAKSPGAERDVD